MRPARPSAIAAAAALCLAMLAGGALARTAPGAGDEVREEPKPDAEAAPGDSGAEADKRVCRYVKLDASSRRKTKVCRTVEEWRDLNNIR